MEKLTDSDPRIEILANRLRAADVAYFNSGEALMEDAAYDAMKDELRLLAPGHPLLGVVGAAPADILAKVKHSIPMGSLDKAMNRDEWNAWVKTMPGGRFVASLKMDGGSVSLEYVDGRLVRAVTRGNGLVGMDITANARQFKQCPKTNVRLGGNLFTGFVRAEIMLLNKDWKSADPDLVSNPRNLGNGIAGRKDGEQAELLSVFAFRAFGIGGSLIAETETQMLEMITEAGFTVAPWRAGSAEDIWGFFQEMGAARSSLDFWIDGIAVKIDELALQTAMGERDQRPRGQIAIKFPAKGKETVLRSVELSVGHTGAIIPTAKFDPVQIDGTTVSSALLCNWNLIRALDVAIGDTIVVYKAGDIIPKILEVKVRPDGRREIPEPTSCPVCGGPVGRKKSVHGDESVMLFCLNDDCPAKLLGKIDRFVRSLNILGIGDEVLEALVKGAIVASPADLYLLTPERLAGLHLGDKGVRLGEKRAKKIIDEIAAKRELTIAELLGSLGIDGLGKRRVVLIQDAVAGELDEIGDWFKGKLSNIDFAARAGVPNLGPVLDEAILAKEKLVREFQENGVRFKARQPRAFSENGKSFCFTGASSVPRKVLAAMATAKGHTVKGDVGQGLDYLVMADPDSVSSKSTKARKLGTKCISEEEFREMVGQ